MNIIDHLRFLPSPPDSSLLYTGYYDPKLVALSILIAVFASHAAFSVAGQIGATRQRSQQLLWLLVGSLAMGGGTWAMHFIGMLAFNLPCRVSYDSDITLISMLPGILASGVALLMISRPRLSYRRLIVSSILLGSGIGAMHYTGMAALRLDGILRYNPVLFAVSIFVAVALALLALWIKYGLQAWRGASRRWVAFGSAVVMGGAVSGMHYTAMAAAYFISDGDPSLPDSALNPTFLATAVSIVTGLLIALVLAATVVQRQLLMSRQLRRNEHQMRRILETAQEGFWLVDGQGDTLEVNAALCAILGRSRDAILARPIFDFVDAANRAIFLRQIEVQAQGESSRYEIELSRPDGSQVPCVFKATPLHDEQDIPSGFFALITDVSGNKEHEAYVRQAVTIFEHASEGIILTDARGKILSVNRAFTRITGYGESEAIGQTPRILQSGVHDADFYRRMWHEVSSTGQWQGEIWNRRKNGETYPERLTISAVRDLNHQIQNFVGVFSDITQQKTAEEQIRNLAFYDSLTQLPNRRMLLDRLGHALAASHRNGQYGALLFIDLDNFKVINDTQGHDIGDVLLTQVSQRLLTCVRDDDTVARLGGDEFVVMLEGLSQEEAVAATQAKMVSEKIHAAINQPFILKEREHHSTPSIGISLFQGHKDSSDELLKRADVAMYQAKDAGRNTIRFFDPAMQAALDARIAMEADLRHALPRHQLRLFYQAQVDTDRRIFGAEVLLRWEHPQRGLVPPAQFIPLAEESGRILAIGHWVLESACQQLKAWQAHPATQELQLAVNVSARQFRQSDFVKQVHTILRQSNINPAKLKLELTESLVLDNVEDTIEKMQALKQFGVGFAMDDFGTGHSSLSYLKQLPLDQLKIDQSFVRDIATDPNDAIIVQTIIVMANSLELDVIAEGVETQAQCDFLRQHGCFAFQGYLFSRPVPLAEFEQLLPRDGNPACG